MVWKEFILERETSPLDTNKSRSLVRLNILVYNLKRNDQFNTYIDIIRDQQENGTVEKVDEKSQGQNNKYYMPHKAVVTEAAQATKVRTVYDASSKSS